MLDQACQALACLVSECPEHQARAGHAGATALLVGHLCKLEEAEEEDQRRWQIQVVHLLLALLVIATQVRNLIQKHMPYSSELKEVAC